MNQQTIADRLNNDGILSPMEYKNSIGVNLETTFKKGTQAKWSYNAVLRILKNEVYIGVLIQGKQTTPNYKVKIRVMKPEDEWVKVENTHEPIITYSKYIRAVSSLKQQKAKESKNFKNIYYSGCCGRALFNAHYGTVFCKQRSFKTDSDCRDIEIKKHDADMEKLEQELVALWQAQEEEETE